MENVRTSNSKRSFLSLIKRKGIKFNQNSHNYSRESCDTPNFPPRNFYPSLLFSEAWKSIFSMETETVGHSFKQLRENEVYSFNSLFNISPISVFSTLYFIYSGMFRMSSQNFVLITSPFNRKILKGGTLNQV